MAQLNDGSYQDDGPIQYPEGCVRTVVWNDGSSQPVIGQPVFYDTVGSNTNVSGCTQSNANRFAGVITASGAPLGDGNRVYVFTPTGSETTATIYCTEAVTAGDIVYPLIGSTGYQKTIQGLMGRGAAQVLETTSGAGTTTAIIYDGPPGVSSAVESVAASGATTISTFGTTYFASGASTPTATLAAGTYIGQRKRFVSATLSSSVAVTVVNTTAGSLICLTGQIQGVDYAAASAATGQVPAINTITAGGSGKNKLTFATGGAAVLMEWYGTGWKLLSVSANVTVA